MDQHISWTESAFSFPTRLQYVQGLGYIAAAVVLAVAYGVYSRVAVPRNLRHIPSVPLLKYGLALLRGDSREQIERTLYIPQQRKYGLYMCIEMGVWSVSVSNPEYVKTLLMRTDIFPKVDIFADKPKNSLLRRFAGRDNILFLNGEDWKRHRIIANPAFHRSMPVKIFGTLTQKLMEKIETRGPGFDVQDYMQRFNLDVIGRASFGFDFNSLDFTSDSWGTIFSKLQVGQLDPLYFVFPLLDQYFLWALPYRRELHRLMDRLYEIINKVIENKRRVVQQVGYEPSGEDDNEKDLLTMMIEANETEKQGGLSNEELRNNIAIFIGGHETTASALTSVLYHLALNKDIQEKARAEAIAVLGDKSEDIIPTLEQTKEFKYINQVIKENLRLHPPVSGVSVRKSTADIDLGPYHIPKGTNMTIDIFAIHHNLDSWPDPDSFNPDRFAENAERDGKKDSAGYSWVPFGGGGRMCIGMNFSLVEQRVVLAMLLRKFELTLPANSIHRNGMIINPNNPITLAAMNMVIDFQPRY